MWLELGIIGTVIGVILGIFIEYWDIREYHKNFKRNLQELKR